MISVWIVPTTSESDIATKDAEDTDEGMEEVEEAKQRHANSKWYT